MPTTDKNLPNRCADCRAAADCKTAFGAFWNDRSHGGVGCRHPFPGYDRRPAELRRLEAAR